MNEQTSPDENKAAVGQSVLNVELGWQLIETCPSDGVEFLAYLTDEPGYNWMEVVSFDGRTYEDASGHLIPEFATHWMPLPAPPNA